MERMSDLIDRESAKAGKVFSRDLREYVVPLRVINSLPAEEPEQADYEDMLRVLFNRCAALTMGTTCLFCGIREECGKRRSVLQEDATR